MTFGMNHPNDEMVDLSDVQLFVAVAKHTSFVGASRKTGVPTSTVSRAIARLEQALGTQLLHRTSRKVVPTQAGAWLLQRAESLVGELQHVLEDVKERQDEPSGRLRVTAPVMTGSEQIGQALLAFAAKYPRVSLELQLTNTIVNLREEGLDLAFRAGPITDQDVVARKLWTAPFALAATPAFVKKYLRGRRTLTAAKLAELPAVVTRSGAAWRFYDTAGKMAELVPREQVCINDPRVAVTAAKMGLGIVRAPRDLIAREGNALVTLSCELGEAEGREMFAVYPSRRLLPLRVRAAIDWVLAGKVA